MLKYLGDCVYIIEYCGSVPILKMELPKLTVGEFLARKWFND